jgi:alpha-beta hydrolase superfamily lysophospholipase
VPRSHGDGLLRWWDPGGDARASLVLCHAYAEHSGRYDAVASRVAEGGLAVWAIDLHGHGASGGERASVPDVAHLVEDVLVALDRAHAARPRLPLFLLGHSMGGLVSTALALEHQERLRGLVLSGAAVSDPTGIEPLLERDPLPEVVLSSDMLSRDPRVGADYDADPLNYRGPFRRETLQALTSGARRVRERFATSSPAAARPARRRRPDRASGREPGPVRRGLVARQAARDLPRPAARDPQRAGRPGDHRPDRGLDPRALLNGAGRAPWPLVRASATEQGAVGTGRRPKEWQKP